MHINPNSSIDEIVAILKQRLDSYEDENRQLKHQLAQARQELSNLRQGIGITVYIEGKAVLGGTGSLPDVASIASPLGKSSSFPPPNSDKRPPAMNTHQQGGSGQPLSQPWQQSQQQGGDSEGRPKYTDLLFK